MATPHSTNLESKFGLRYLRAASPVFLILLLGSLITTAGHEKRQILDETLRQAETALKENRLEEALDKCRKVIELEPKSARAYYLLARIQGRRGNQDETKQALLQALKLDPSHIPSRTGLAGFISTKRSWMPQQESFAPQSNWVTLRVQDTTDWLWFWSGSRSFPKHSRTCAPRSRRSGKILKGFSLLRPLNYSLSKWPRRGGT